MKLSIGKKISGGYIIILVLLLILGCLAVVNLRNMKEEVNQVTNANDRLIRELRIESEFQKGVAAIRGFVGYGDEKYFQQMEDNLNSAIKMEEELLIIAEEDQKEDIRELIRVTKEYSNSLSTTYSTAIRNQHKALNEGRLDEANILKDNVMEIAGALVPVTEKLTSILNSLVEDDIAQVNEIVTSVIANADKVVNSTLIITIAALLIGIVLSLVLTRMIKNPIIQMVDGAAKYAEGDLTKSINVRSEDELGQLASAMNIMQVNIKNIIENILESSHQLGQSSQEVSNAADETTKASTQVAQAVTLVASGTEKQLSSISEIAAITEEMSAAIEEIAASSNAVSSSADTTFKSAKEGAKVIGTVINQMNNIERTVASTAEAVYTLGERSKQIGQIVNTISGIAGQTNLLALNAAIEAARAGEQGRGFAVVAEEVRKLAEQSQEAAKQIADLIGVIQGETDRVVDSMNEGTREVKVGSDVVNKAGESFDAIVKHIEGVSRQVQEISASTQQMAAGSQKVVTSIHSIDKISKDIAGQTQSVSAATEEQVASMEQIAAASQTLLKMADVLDKTVKKFRV